MSLEILLQPYLFLPPNSISTVLNTRFLQNVSIFFGLLNVLNLTNIWELVEL